MILLINTSKFDQIELALVQADQVINELTVEARFAHQEKLIKSIAELFKQSKVQPTKLIGIIVVRGEGSFSALRIGLAVANTMAWQLAIPIVGVTNDKFKNCSELYQLGKKLLAKQTSFNLVLPVYGQAPNINIKK